MSAALLFLALAIPAGAEPTEWLSAKAEVPPPPGDGGSGSFVVGVPFRVSVEAKHNPGGIALIPEKLSLPEALAEREGARRHLRREESGEQIDRYELELIAFEPGDLSLPSIRLAFGSTVAETRPLEIHVVSGLDEDEQKVASSTLAEAIEELEKSAAQNPSPRAVNIPDYRPLYAAGALVLGLVGALLVRGYLRRRALRAQAAAPPPPPRPADEVALERLAVLAKTDRSGPRLQKAFWVELSEILRGYVGARFGFDSIELTVAELFDALERHPTPGLDRATLRRLLDLADLAKFAKLITPDEDCQDALHRGQGLVEATRPRPPPPAEAEGPEARP